MKGTRKRASLLHLSPAIGGGGHVFVIKLKVDTAQHCHTFRLTRYPEPFIILARLFNRNATHCIITRHRNHLNVCSVYMVRLHTFVNHAILGADMTVLLTIQVYVSMIQGIFLLVHSHRRKQMRPQCPQATCLSRFLVSFYRVTQSILYRRGCSLYGVSWVASSGVTYNATTLTALRV